MREASSLLFLKKQGKMLGKNRSLNAMTPISFSVKIKSKNIRKEGFVIKVKLHCIAILKTAELQKK